MKLPNGHASSSQDRHAEPMSMPGMGWTVILLCLPAIVGTGFFVAAVVLTGLLSRTPPTSDPFTAPSSSLADLGFVLFLCCYFGAAFGPLLLPVAGLFALLLTRAIGLRSRPATWAWTFVFLGLVATALFWGWLINLDIFV